MILEDRRFPRFSTRRPRAIPDGRGPENANGDRDGVAIAAVACHQLTYWQMNFRSSMKMS